jgi:hypothetical protein
MGLKIQRQLREPQKNDQGGNETRQHNHGQERNHADHGDDLGGFMIGVVLFFRFP